MVATSKFPEADLARAIEEADFVGFAIKNPESELPDRTIKATEVMKGNRVTMSARLFNLRMESNVEYLLLATLKHEDAVKFHYQVKRRDQLTKEEVTILDTMPCYSEEVDRNPGIDGCTRGIIVGHEVCGCDQKNYGNTCEMRMNGILKYKPGYCKDH